MAAARNPQDQELFVVTTGRNSFALEEAAVDAFVEGSFQRALKLANQCLKHLAIKHQTSWADRTDCIVLQTSLKLAESKEYNFLLQRKLHGPDPIDRLAAVILQSWYEISKQASSDVDLQQGQVHLETFFKTYSMRPCSLELMLVLVQFLRATARAHEAIELASETLFHVFAEHNESMFFLKEELCDVVRELIDFLFQNIPFCNDVSTVQEGLRRFCRPDWTAFNSGRKWILTMTNQPPPSSVSACLTFLENPPLHWPDECKSLMDDCRGKLEDMSLELQQSHSLSSSSGDSADSSSAVPMTSVREASGSYAILPTLGSDGSIDQWFRHIVHVLRAMVFDPMVLSERRWPNRIRAAFAVWMLWTAWKRRGRTRRLLSEALMKPLQELLDALIPGR